MSTLGKAVIEFSAETAKFTSDVGRTAHVFTNSMARMEAGVANLRNALVAAAGLGGLGLIIKGAIDAGDQLNKLSQKTGLTVERLSELRLAAELGDADLESFTRGMKEFNKSLVEAQDQNSKAAQIFKALGVDIAAGPDAALRRFAEAISSVEKDEVKLTAGSEIMGRTFQALLPMFNQGAKGLDEVADKARRLGLIMSAEFAKQSEQFNDNLKLLQKNTEALGIKAGGGLLGGLETLTSRLVAATEKGEGFIGFLRESLLLMTAMAQLTLLPRGAGQFIFDLAEGNLKRGRGLTPGQYQQMMKEHAARWGQGGGEFVGPPVLNQEAVACAASGGKWVNGRCQRPGDAEKAKAAKEKELRDYIRAAERIDKAEEEFAKEVAEAWSFVPAMEARLKRREELENIFGDDATGMTTEALEQKLKLLLEGIDYTQEWDIRVGQLKAGFDGMGNALKETTSRAAELGLVFESAASDAMRNWQGVQHLLKSIALDIAQIEFKKRVLEPFGRAAGTLLDKVIGSTFGAFGGDVAGAVAEGGPVMGGRTYLVGERGPELFTPPVSGTVIPNHALAGAGGGNPTVNVYFSANTPAAVRAAVLEMMPAIQSASITAVRNANVRGR